MKPYFCIFINKKLCGQAGLYFSLSGVTTRLLELKVL